MGGVPVHAVVPDPEPGKAAVVDAVEDGDLEPGERGSSEHLAGVWVPQHVLERLPSGPIPSHRLDGSSSQLLNLLQLGVVPHGDLFVLSWRVDLSWIWLQQ